MIDATFASLFILLLTSAVLFYVALNDLRELRIRNELIIALAVLFCVHALVSGNWAYMHYNAGLALAGFVFMLYWYNQGLIGGGDLKLLTVALLWSGVRCVLPFLAIMVAAALLHTLLGRIGWVNVKYVNARMKIAFAPSIAAGLIGIFMLGCLHPPAPDVSAAQSPSAQVPLR